MIKPEIGRLTDGILCIPDAERASAWTFVGNIKIYLIFISVYDICCHFLFLFYFAILVLNPILSSAVPMITNIMALPPDCTILPLTDVKKEAVNPNMIPSAI